LRDDCYDYAARMEAAGVAASVRHEPELVHASLAGAAHLACGRLRCLQAIADAIREFTA
jgi:acetyl esterase/lipase